MLGVAKGTVVTVLVSLGAGLLVGGLIGHFGTPRPDDDGVDSPEASDWGSEDIINQRIVNLVNRERLKENFRNLTMKPHLATSDRDDVLAHMIRDTFEASNFDEAYLAPMNVYLSLPDPLKPNKITWMNGTGDVVFESEHMEEALHEDDADPDFVHAFNAYSPAETVETRPGQGLVYVNYGREEDFEKLKDLGVNVSGHIVIARYGKIFRGNKVLQAQERGAIGVILFSDPEDVAAEGTADEDVYPNTWWLPGSGMQRGSIFVGDGDPLTPGWPSTDYAHRIEEKDAGLPTIPCQPIGYDDAREILEKMGGTQAPEAWIGGIQEVKYNLGPQFTSEYSDYTLQIKTNNKGSVEKSYNVFGIIRGGVEPDRYVLVGNHRDAWGYGATDPSSGTAQLMETAMVFGELVKAGWRPRRTIVFCSWGAEEHGLIGSTEWVEEHVSKLQNRAVMYLNTDSCTKGPILKVEASPLLWGAVTKLTKLMPGVAEGKTLFDEWEDYHKYFNRSKPKVDLTGSGSDHAAFAFYAGIPTMDMSFSFDGRKYNISSYPYYHTGYETFYMVAQLIDPDFKITQGCSRLSALILRYFADSRLLPFSLTDLPAAMDGALDAIEEAHKDKLSNFQPYFENLGDALTNLTEQMNDFDAELKEKDVDPVSLRAVNDQLMALERLLIIPSGLPNRPLTRHAIFAPSQFDNYASQGFPGIADLFYKFDELTGAEKAAREEAMKRHLSQLTFILQSVTSFLKDLHLI